MRTFFATGAAALLVAASAVIQPTAAQADEPEDDGLRYEASTTFELEPDEKRVRVSMDITVTNEVPSDGYTYYYFDSIYVPSLAEATNVVAESSGGSTLSTSFEDSKLDWGALVVSLPAQLTYGEEQSLSVQFDLPNQAPRTDGWTSATAAYASFPVFAVGDAGLADVRVVVPDSYEVTTSGTQMSESTDDGDFVYEEKEIDKPWNWWVSVAAQNPEKLKTKNVTVDDIEVELLHWPGDKKWAGFVSKQVKSGLPALEKVVGEPYPAPDTLTITESGTPHIFGLGGFYDSEEHAIEVSDELDKATLLHELSHAWFNHDVASEIWIVEGLAEAVSRRALAISDGKAPKPEEVSRDDDAAQPLVEWQGVYGEPTPEDDYGYSASLWVFAELADEIGDKKFTKVVSAAVADTMPYAGDEAVTASGTVNWRRMLDLLEEVGGSESAKKMFVKWVISDREKGELKGRDPARKTYAALEKDGAGWAPPLELRAAMTDWQYSKVDDLTTGARDVLADRDEVLAMLDGFGVDEMPGFEAEYESAKSIEKLNETSTQYVDVAQAMEEVDEGGGFASTLVNTVGLVGYDVDGKLDDSAQALADGKVGEAEKLIVDIEDHVDGAPLQSGIRLAGAAIVMLLMFIVRGVRKRRSGRSVAEDDTPHDLAQGQPLVDTVAVEVDRRELVPANTWQAPAPPPPPPPPAPRQAPPAPPHQPARPSAAPLLQEPPEPPRQPVAPSAGPLLQEPPAPPHQSAPPHVGKQQGGRHAGRHRRK